MAEWLGLNHYGIIIKKEDIDMNGKERKLIPGTNYKWGVKLPEGYDNSLVTSSGSNRDDGYNFDEPSDDEEEDDDDFESEWDSLDKKH